MIDERTDQTESLAQYAARISLRFAIPTGILFALIVIIANWNRDSVPMLGDHRAFATLALYMLVPTTLVASGVAYVMGVYGWNQRVPADRQRTWYWAVLPVALAFALVLFFLTAVALQLIEMAFRDLELATIQGALLAGAGGAAIIRWAVRRAMYMQTGKLLDLILIVIAGGVYLTAVTIEDPLWFGLLTS